jgi:hypothetical protein
MLYYYPVVDVNLTFSFFLGPGAFWNDFLSVGFLWDRLTSWGVEQDGEVQYLELVSEWKVADSGDE